MCSHQSSTRSSTECSSKSLWVSADGFPCSFKSFSRSRCARSASTTRSVQSCSISHLQRQSSVDPRIPYIFHLQHLVEHILSLLVSIVSTRGLSRYVVLCSQSQSSPCQCLSACSSPKLISFTTLVPRDQLFPDAILFPPHDASVSCVTSVFLGRDR